MSVQTGGSSCPHNTINNSHTSFTPVNTHSLHCLHALFSGFVVCVCLLLKPCYTQFLFVFKSLLRFDVLSRLHFVPSLGCTRHGRVRHSCVDEHTHKHSSLNRVCSGKNSHHWRVRITQHNRPKHSLWNHISQTPLSVVIGSVNTTTQLTYGPSTFYTKHTTFILSGYLWFSKMKLEWFNSRTDTEPSEQKSSECVKTTKLWLKRQRQPM